MIIYAQSEKTILQEIDVKDGDTLWSIANYYLKDPRAWPEILKYNKLPSSDPNVILPGMKLKIPVVLVKENLRPAYLIYLLNDVKYKKKKTVEWQKAYLNLELYNDDSVRTMAQSKANIKFITGEIVKLDQNTLVILRPEKPREELELFSGAVKASNAKILTEGAIIEPKLDPKLPKPDYKTKIKEDKTTLVEVYDGVVDVSAQGKTVTLTKGFGTEVKYLSPPSLPHKLPPLPEFDLGKEPSNQLKELVTRDTLSLNLSQENYSKVISELKVKQYHLQIASDEEFNKIVIDETKYIRDITDFELQKYNLKEGKYYYRVAYIDELGFESKFTTAQMFIIDKTPPNLVLTHPQENEKIIEDIILIEGQTEPDATLKINNNIISIDNDGKFRTSISAIPGRNKIVIISKDKAGNYTEVERNVYQVKSAVGGKKMVKESSLKTPKWLETPTGIAISVATLLIILGVIINILIP